MAEVLEWEVLVEPAAFATGLATALARAGVPVPPERAGRFALALRLVPPDSREPLYWTARTTLVSHASQVAVFDAVFAAVFSGGRFSGGHGHGFDPADGRSVLTAPPPVRSPPQPGAADGPGGRPVAAAATDDHGAMAAGGREGTDAEGEAVPALASAAERMRHTSFAELEPDEIAGVRELVRRMVLSTPARRTRRTTASARTGERLDMRRTLRAAQRSGGDPVHLVHRRRRSRTRRLVLICDVSGSMEPYTKVYLALLQGAAAGARGEAFVFSTRLTRLTRQLAGRDPDEALAAAAVTAPDWSGGTLLAGSLRRFIDDYGRRGLARGAVVVVLSDGWAHEERDLVAAQMARLRRLAYRIVWVNPRMAAPGFAPLAGGMAAALPYCDAFVSGHTVAALGEVAEALRSSTERFAPYRSRSAPESTPFRLR